MKLLSIAVPCYNSQDYMRHCVETLLPGGDEVEILVVDDGSKDGTAAIADELEAQHPGVVRAIHQENGGHGAAVMAGLKNATGLYFKVVDSDDWLDEKAYPKVLDALRGFAAAEGEPVDLLVCNYIYDKVGAKHKKVMEYRGVLPEGRPLHWNEAGHFRKGQYILMHSVIYRTQLLRDCKLDLPRHTFYVDNLYVYVPMRWVRTLYYLDLDLYHYYIGREDQSVNEAVMIRRIDQQLRVNKLMLEQVDLQAVKEPRLRKYLFNYLEIITTVSSILLIRGGEKEHLEKKRQLWQYIRTANPWAYKKLRWGLFGIVMNLPGAPGRAIAVAAYKISQKVVGFN